MSYKIDSISIEGMHNVQTRKFYSFEDFNYLYGKNGSGKSTVLTAIQWGLLGYIPGTDKRVSAIWDHHNPNSRKMSVDLIIKDGTERITIHRELFQQGKSVSTNFYTEPEDYDLSQITNDIELPIFNFSDFMNLSRNAMKDWFLKFLPATKSEFDIGKALRDAVADIKITNEEEFERNIKSLSHLWDTGSKGVDGMQELNTEIKSKLSYKKGEADRLRSTLQSLVKYDEVDESMTSDDIREEMRKLEASRESWLKQIDDIISIEQAKNAFINFRDKNANLAPEMRVSADVESLMKEQAELTELLSEKKEQIDKINAQRQDINVRLKVIESMLNSDKGVCPYTQCKCAEMDSVIQTYKDKQSELSEEVNKLQKEHHDLQQDIVGITDNIASLSASIQSVNSDKARWEWYDRQLADLMNDIKEIEEELELPEASIEELQSKIDETTDELYKLDNLRIKVAANEHYSKMYEEIQADLYSADETIDCYKAWEKATGVNGYQTQFADAPLAELASNVNKYLREFYPDDTALPEAKFILEAKANSFEFGLIKDNVYRPFKMLSSGEKCIYTLALFIAIVFESNCNIATIMIDDMLDHLDDTKIAPFFNAIKKISETNKQFIIAGVQPCELVDSVINI